MSTEVTDQNVKWFITEIQVNRVLKKKKTPALI